MFKKFVQNKLESYVKRYLAKHPDVKLIAVGGSIGKTSTKHAIASVLSQKLRVRMQNENYNTELSAPLGILGIDYPENPRSIVAWLTVFRAAAVRVRQPDDIHVIVQEFGSDKPGDIAAFTKYLTPDIAVITGVTPEHMETFGTIEAVAQEELTLANAAKQALINRDDIDGRFAQFITDSALTTYGTSGAAEYRFETQDTSIADGYVGQFYLPEFAEPIEATLHVIGEHSLRPVIAAAAIGAELGLGSEEIKRGVEAIRPIPGRMNILRGQENSTLLDDTYNSSPAAASAALQALYLLDAPQRIAILGDMNELGAVSAKEHEFIGSMCDPNLLSWVVTVGSESEKYLAPAARARGCQVKSFKSPLEAGGFVHSVIEEGSIVLVKGSQTNVYCEEAVKVLLHATEDDVHLVRQSAQWQQKKAAFFSDISE
jgi:UDP-N-acetylmuramoyl-tripeptide--D-alanyl-D-alanine ligase